MLKNLIGYDLKKILKFLVWFYAISLVLAGICRLLNIWSDIEIIKIISSVFASLTYSALATVLINTFIHILLRFSTNLFKDQSYLTHTLPIKKETLILSKYLSSLIVILFSVIVCFLSLFIVLYSADFMQNIKKSIESMVSGFNISSGLFIAIFILLVFSQICTYISLGFLAIIKGYSYNNKRGVKGFLWFVLYFLICFVSIFLLIILVSLVFGEFDGLFSAKMSGNAFLIVLIVALIGYISFAILFYFLGVKQFKKGVNVD